jgi:hypothetical protein
MLSPGTPQKTDSVRERTLRYLVAAIPSSPVDGETPLQS